MLLQEYMKDRKIKVGELAKALGVSQPYASRLKQGTRTPSLHLAAKIEEWSGGVVKAATLALERAA